MKPYKEDAVLSIILAHVISNNLQKNCETNYHKNS